jgi:16S rRNA (cytidine1402-2'-O)-methyltransferase
LPRRAGQRRVRLDDLVDEERTMVFFEAPHRTAETLGAMAEVFGAERPAAVCRELTKTYEEVRRGPLGELAEWAADGVRGEVTLVVQGEVAEPVEDSPGMLKAMVEIAEKFGGMSRRDAIADVAKKAGRPKRDVYDAVHRD